MQDAGGETFSFSSSEIATGSVPVPGSLALLGIGAIGLAVGSRKEKGLIGVKHGDELRPQAGVSSYI